MFHHIPESIKRRMQHLEKLDAQDRIDGTPHLKRMRQIPPETGKLLALLAANTPDGHWIEIGTSAGYSTLWLALACREVGRKITTFEILEHKAAVARQTFQEAGVEDVVKLVVGDARSYLSKISDISFCFLDAEKDVYLDCYEMIVPVLVKGGLLVADNAINHQEALKHVIDRAFSDERVAAMIVPIGKGELVCRKSA